MSGTKKFGNGSVPIAIIVVIAFFAGIYGWNCSHRIFIAVMNGIGVGATLTIFWAFMRIVLMRFQRT